LSTRVSHAALYTDLSKEKIKENVCNVKIQPLEAVILSLLYYRCILCLVQTFFFTVCSVNPLNGQSVSTCHDGDCL